MTDARLSQLPAEALVTGESDTRLSQLQAEALLVGESKARVSQVEADVLGSGPADARLSALAVDVLFRHGHPIRPAGIPSEESLGSPVVTGASVINGAGQIASAEAFGTPTRWNLAELATPATLIGEVGSIINVASIPRSDGVGEPSVTSVGTSILPVPIPSGESLGVAWAVNLGALSPPATLLGEVDGEPTPAGVIPESIHSLVRFGRPLVVDARTIIVDDGIPSGERFGSPALSHSFRTVAAWIGGQPNVRYVPVTVGAVADLCGCMLPDGRGMLVWRDTVAGEVRMAILHEPEAWLEDGVIDDLSQVTTLASHDNVLASSCFSRDGQVYVSYAAHDGPHFVQKIWRALDPLNPVAYEEHATFADQTLDYPPAFGIWHEGMGSQGLPLVDGDRWVLPQTQLFWWLNAGLAQIYGMPALWLSTDGGRNFSRRLLVTYDPPLLNPPSFMRFASPLVYGHPQTGALYWYTSGGWGAQNTRLYESKSAGLNWSQIQSISGNHDMIPFTQWDGSMYSLNARSLQVVRNERVPGGLSETYAGITYVGGSSYAETKPVMIAPKPPDSTRLFLFIHNTVQSYLPGILVGSVGVG